MFYRNSRNKRVLWTLKNYFNQLATSLLWITLFVILICVNPIVRNITNCHVVSEKIIWLIQMPMFREKFTEKNISTTLEIIRILIAFIINLFVVRSHKNPTKWLLIIWQRIENLHTKYYIHREEFSHFSMRTHWTKRKFTISLIKSWFKRNGWSSRDVEHIQHGNWNENLRIRIKKYSSSNNNNIAKN